MTSTSGRLLLGAALAAGVTVRVAGLWTDLWLDEIWSLNIARGYGYSDILLRVPFDNNHILNTLWLRWVGEPGWFGWYRLPALAAGLAAVALAGRVGERWGRLEGMLAAAVAALSFPLALYSSEARGHMPMVAFALGAYLCLDSWLRTRARRAYAGWSACVVLGFLSQLMFAQAYAAFLVWTWAAVLKRRVGWKEFLWLHAPGAAVAAFVGSVQLRGMGFGGGPDYSALGMLRETLALALGCPDGPWAWAVGALGLAAAAWGVRDLARRGCEEWGFFAVVVFAAPASLLALHPPVLFPRYFLLAMAFSAPLWARGVAVASRAGRGRGIAAAALALFGAGHAVRCAGFLKDGRGRYREALGYIAERSGGSVATIGSGHDFATRMIVEFYAPRVSGGGFRYVPRTRWTKDEPRWVLGHGERRDPAPQAELTALNGNRYRLERIFRYSEQSGWDWSLYSLANSTSDP